mmetsp:Transcript_6819/g.10436  ORF Transcript_6819/g.10436 Transcript_6819/m.10436 type:complete len:367 (+) Transcript_6819:184-1284(+)
MTSFSRIASNGGIKSTGKDVSVSEKPCAQSVQHTWTETFLIAVYVVGIWIAFLVYGWSQEALAKEDFQGESFHFTHSLVLLQSLSNMAVAFGGILFDAWYTGQPFTINAGVRLWHWFIASLGYQGAHFFGLQSLHYVSFPVQIVCKSCKTLPVLIGEYIICGIEVSLKKGISVVILSLGVILFLFYKPSKKGKHASSEFELTPEFVWGLLMIFLALICDGIYGPYQTYIRKSYKQCGAFHLMFNMNMWQGLFSVIFVLRDGELFELISFIDRHPKVISYLIEFCVSMAIGSTFIYLLQRYCGALVVTKATTVRKLMSVLASAYFFNHTINAVQWAAVVIVFTCKYSSSFLANRLLECQPKRGDKVA